MYHFKHFFCSYSLLIFKEPVIFFFLKIIYFLFHNFRFALTSCLHSLLNFVVVTHCLGFPRDSVVNKFTCKAGDAALILGREDLLEKEAVRHSSILAWRTPRTEDPGRLQSAGSQSQTPLSD